MKFEIGKKYRHTTGTEISVIGRLQTTMYGNSLIAECVKTHEDLIVVGSYESATANWSEISNDEWMDNFSK
jgi:hypothetical protein